jgi:hypothetical protein
MYAEKSACQCFRPVSPLNAPASVSGCNGTAKPVKGLGVDIPRIEKGRSKYNAVRTNGYASKKEAEYAEGLAAAKAAGDISFWLEQVPFKLPGGSKYLLDFVVFTLVPKTARAEHLLMVDKIDRAELHWAFDVRFVEVKGRDLPLGKLKRRQTEELYGIKIEVV